MKIELLSNTKNKDISISNDVFSKEFNESLIHQAVVSFMASSRQGSAKQKNRSEVRGGGKKPYRQKGTGRARAGTIRSPLWRGGGVTFASRPRDFSKKINKSLGLRHKAGIGITEESDAISIVISEETGKLSYIKSGKIISFKNNEELKSLIINDLL